jgi:hypothetical protein
MSKRVADLLVETLQAAGVKTCYGIVGDTLNRIAHAIDRSEINIGRVGACGRAGRDGRGKPPSCAGTPEGHVYQARR